MTHSRNVTRAEALAIVKRAAADLEGRVAAIDTRVGIEKQQERQRLLNECMDVVRKLNLRLDRIEKGSGSGQSATSSWADVFGVRRRH